MAPQATAVKSPAAPAEGLAGVIAGMTPETLDQLEAAIRLAKGTAPAKETKTSSVARVARELREKRLVFLKPENIRPDSEVYRVTVDGGGEHSFTLRLPRTIRRENGGDVEDGDNLSFVFQRPGHQIGTDLWTTNPETGMGHGFEASMVDVCDHYDVKVTAACIAWAKENGIRLPEGIAPRNSQGHFTLRETMVALREQMPVLFKAIPISAVKKTHLNIKDLTPIVKTGEEYREWLRGVYTIVDQQDALRETIFGQSGTEDRLSAITGRIPLEDVA